MARTKSQAARASKAKAIAGFSARLANLRSEFRWIAKDTDDERCIHIDRVLSELDLIAFQLAQDIESGRVVLTLPDEPRPLFERTKPVIKPAPAEAEPAKGPPSRLDELLERQEAEDHPGGWRGHRPHVLDLSSYLCGRLETFGCKTLGKLVDLIDEGGLTALAKKIDPEDHIKLSTIIMVSVQSYLELEGEDDDKAEQKPPTRLCLTCNKTYPMSQVGCPDCIHGPIKLPHTDAPGGPDWLPGHEEKPKTRKRRSKEAAL